MLWHLVVLVKLSVLVKWLARKTPLRKSICADGIVFPGWRVFMNFMIVSFHYLIIWCVGLVLCDIFYTPLSPFYRPFSRWTLVSRYQNVSVLDFIGAKDDGGGDDNGSCKMCEAPVKSSPTNQQPTFDKPFLSPNQQCQSTEEKYRLPVICTCVLLWATHTLGNIFHYTMAQYSLFVLKHESANKLTDLPGCSGNWPSVDIVIRRVWLLPTKFDAKSLFRMCTDCVTCFSIGAEERR